ncbi:MAG: hypothetical protein IT309_08220 [Anaerolineales bacterium]|nr:hypothetical protein [Anaerolineales bacterium]
MPRHLSFQEQDYFIVYYSSLAYNHAMLEPVFQALALYLFAATPCFAGWIANGGKREDIGIPLIASLLLTLALGLLLIWGQ